MFQGSMVALVTPMKEDGSVDKAALRKLIDFHVDNGTDAIVSVGTTGESATLNMQEHCDTVRETVTHAAGRIPIIAGTGANSTSEAIELTRCSADAGVDACLLVTPYYNKPTQEGLYQHHKAIAEAVAIPQILYNVPGRTAVDMLPGTVVRLAEIENIIGIKEATGSIERAREIISQCDDDFEVYSGDDDTAMELILNGARADISVTANVAPKEMHDMCTAALAGDKETASEINSRLQDLHSTLFLESNPIPVKWAVQQMGMIGPKLRLPLTEFSSIHHDAVRNAMKAAGVL